MAERESERAAAAEGGALALDTLQRALLAPLSADFAEAARDPAARAGWLELAAAVDALEVPEPLVERLSAIVEAALQSGRARRGHGPGAELALRALYSRTPRGRAAAHSVAALNAALAELAGQPLSGAGAALRGPGAYALTLTTPRATLVIGFAPDGVRLESVEVEVG